MQHWNSDLVCFGDGRICGVSRPLLRFVSKRTDLPLFSLHLRTAFFEAHLLSPLKIWELRALKSYKVFMEPAYTIVIRKIRSLYTSFFMVTLVVEQSSKPLFFDDFVIHQNCSFQPKIFD